MSSVDVEALRSFVDDNEDLEQLETIRDRFRACPIDPLSAGLAKQ